MADDDDKPRTDTALSNRDWAHANFREALKRLPLPIPMYDDGAACPTCGEIHTTIDLKAPNECVNCKHTFFVGNPDWNEEGRLVTWVPFPHWEMSVLGDKAHLMEKWEPNERVKMHYEVWRKWREDKKQRLTAAPAPVGTKTH